MAFLNVDDVVQLAPDARAVNAGRGLAVPERWSGLGAEGDAMWGRCQGSAAEPYLTQVDAARPAFACSCPSRKVPCKHAVGLLLLHATRPDLFAGGAPPAEVAEWLVRELRPAVAEGGAEPQDPAAVARRAGQREAAVEAGVGELERFLEDVARGGLAAAQARPAAAWDAVAARMVDAKAPGLARLVRGARAAAFAGDGAEEALLERLGVLSLLLAAFRRRDELPPGLHDDVRALVGWTQNQDELRAGGGVRDRWLVLGQRTREDDQLRQRRTWLAPAGGGDVALLLEFAYGARPFDERLVPGRTLEAEVAFFPSALPQRAVLAGAAVPRPEAAVEPPGRASVAEALDAYAEALGRNPWLERFPLALHEAVPVRDDERWALRDGDDALLPLRCPPADGLRLTALSAGRPIWVFGEWDGRRLRPLATRAGGRHVALQGDPW